MNYLDLTLELLTPAFLSGANQRAVELRAASVKGLVRWWWRASEGHRFGRKEDLREAEGRLFGSAQLGRRSPLDLSVGVREPKLSVVPRGHLGPTSSATYEWRRRDREGRVRSGTAQYTHYLGYGPIRIPTREEREAAQAGRDPELLGEDGRVGSRPVFIRPAIATDQRLNLRLAWRDETLSGEQVGGLLNTVGAWIMLGGIGSRSRKGWGALALAGVAGAPETLVEQAGRVFSAWARDLLRNGDDLPDRLPAWPQLRYRRMLHITAPQDSWQEALGRLGRAYKSIRPGNQDPLRWICGEASPRRASSVLLTVVREGDRCRGVMIALPCSKNETDRDPAPWRTFLDRAGERLPEVEV